MKCSLIIFATIIYLSFAYFHELQYKTGDDILYKLKAGNHNIYVMIFFNPGEGHEHTRTTNQHMIEKVEKEFLYRNDVKDLYYAPIDATDPTFAGLLDALTVDVDDLINTPQLFIMEHGNGYIISGPRAVEEMEQNLQELLGNKDQGF